jgi:hypothetical protein
MCRSRPEILNALVESLLHREGDGAGAFVLIGLVDYIPDLVQRLGLFILSNTWF